MEIAGLMLAVIGIVLTVLLSDHFFRGINFVMDKIQRRRWKGKQYRDGVLQDKSHIAFDDWRCHFEVDIDGNCTQKYDVRLINVSDHLVNDFYLPVFSDGKPLPFQDLAAWARMQRKDLVVESDEWNETDAEGRLKIVFQSPLAPGERIRFQYGLTLPHLFQKGDDYYNWDIEVPYYDMKGEINFASGWTVKYARWNVKGNAFCPQPVLSDSRIRWTARFPSPNTRLHMDFGLHKHI